MVGIVSLLMPQAVIDTPCDMQAFSDRWKLAAEPKDVTPWRGPRSGTAASEGLEASSVFLLTFKV